MPLDTNADYSCAKALTDNTEAFFDVFNRFRYGFDRNLVIALKESQLNGVRALYRVLDEDIRLAEQFARITGKRFGFRGLRASRQHASNSTNSKLPRVGRHGKSTSSQEKRAPSGPTISARRSKPSLTSCEIHQRDGTYTPAAMLIRSRMRPQAGVLPR